MGWNALRRMAGLRMEARSACWIPLSELASAHLNSSSIGISGQSAYLFSIVRRVMDVVVSGERVVVRGKSFSKLERKARNGSVRRLVPTRLTPALHTSSHL